MERKTKICGSPNLITIFPLDRDYRPIECLFSGIATMGSVATLCVGSTIRFLLRQRFKFLMAPRIVFKLLKEEVESVSPLTPKQPSRYHFLLMDNYRNYEADEAFSNDVVRTLEGHVHSLLSPQADAPHAPDNGVCVPQRPYKNGTAREDPKHRHRVLFMLEDGSYLPLIRALEERYSGLMNRDIQVLVEVGDTLMIRIEWPGYPSKGSQLRTLDWCVPPKKITLRKLATEVAKVIQKFVQEAQAKPIDPACAEWRVGPNAIKVEHLRLAQLEQVSSGSWQARLFYMPPN
ncbi:hypothetical protein BJ322DRAFT_131219 [Thelephora terrestris]|uniref:Uncharacterized protein n=1 Tax=Thelephora terrestris TaxID=56493 RepID=A0A9P6HSJ9_9AGAM|nr:hypothetical protein BJ322DRAFT_131219 [Thelephora terrestris]